MKRELVVARDIAEEAARRFLAIGPRTVVLSGGSTPRPVYQRLAALDHPWSEVEVFFSDERCVPPDHPDSNYRMARETLLSNVPARVHRMLGERCDAQAYEEKLTNVFGARLPQFDLLLLGLGEDGHTASLFPGDPALEERERRVLQVRGPDHPRLTLTLPVLSAAQVAMFLVAGASKRAALQELLGDSDSPATRVRAREIVIVADEAAAGDEGSPSGRQAS